MRTSFMTHTRALAALTMIGVGVGCASAPSGSSGSSGAPTPTSSEPDDDHDIDDGAQIPGDYGGTLAGGEGDDPGAGPVAPVPQPPNLAAYQSLLAEVRRIASVEQHTKYTHTTTINEATETFDVDCSGYVNYALERVVPDAFKTLASKTASRPVAESYVQLISKDAPIGRWHAVPTVTDLVPGDIIAWLEPKDVKSSDTGHVMVVAEPLVKGSAQGEYEVTIYDSTESGHGAADARTSSNVTGVGVGTIVLRTNSKGAPIGYRWSTDAGSNAETTTVTLAHLY